MAPNTDFDDLVETRERETASTAPRSVTYQVIGAAITADEVKAALSASLYDQLTDGSDDTALAAAVRAVVYCGSVVAKLGKVCNLDDPVIRQAAIQMTICELHLGLGHAEAGREHRLKAKDLIIAAFGSYPDADKSEEAPPALGAVTTEPRKAYP